MDEGVWTSPSNLSQSPKKVAPEADFSKGLDLEVPTSPPVSLHHLTAATETLGMPGFGHSPPQPQSHPSKGNNPSRAPEMVPAKTQTGPETPSKKSADKAVSVEVRAWDELGLEGGLFQRVYPYGMRIKRRASGRSKEVIPPLCSRETLLAALCEALGFSA